MGHMHVQGGTMVVVVAVSAVLCKLCPCEALPALRTPAAVPIDLALAHSWSPPPKRKGGRATSTTPSREIRQPAPPRYLRHDSVACSQRASNAPRCACSTTTAQASFRNAPHKLAEGAAAAARCCYTGSCRLYLNALLLTRAAPSTAAWQTLLLLAAQ